MKAYLKNYSQPPRKVRLVADLIRGKDVQKARAILSFLDKKAAPDLKKLLDSALANAQSQKKDTKGLVVKDVRVDAGIALRRWRPRAFGRATPFRRRKSSITLQLAEKQ